jgi:hypothetical protein
MVVEQFGERVTFAAGGSRRLYAKHQQSDRTPSGISDGSIGISNAIPTARAASKSIVHCSSFAMVKPSP